MFIREAALIPEAVFSLLWLLFGLCVTIRPRKDYKILLQKTNKVMGSGQRSGQISEV